MIIYKLHKMIKGWFVGNFEPSVYKTNNFEVGYKVYKSGDFEPCHYHKIATEITVITEGKVLMNNCKYESGDIIVIPPEQATDFQALTDVNTIVVKIPCCSNDKFLK